MTGMCDVGSVQDAAAAVCSSRRCHDSVLDCNTCTIHSSHTSLQCYSSKAPHLCSTQCVCSSRDVFATHHSIKLEEASTHKSAKTHAGNVFVTSNPKIRPAHVAQSSKHSGAMCSRAWHVQWPGFAPQPGRFRLPKNYFK